MLKEFEGQIVSCASSLIDKDADVYAQDNRGNTALDILVDCGLDSKVKAELCNVIGGKDLLLIAADIQRKRR